MVAVLKWHALDAYVVELELPAIKLICAPIQAWEGSQAELLPRTDSHRLHVERMGATDVRRVRSDMCYLWESLMVNLTLTQ
jgi:hypothetical protein